MVLRLLDSLSLPQVDIYTIMLSGTDSWRLHLLHHSASNIDANPNELFE
jgi:hypothetical protein